MESKILKVVRQGEAFSVQSAKAETGFENEYVCAMLGNLAGRKFSEGDLVVATMRFSTHEYQGQTFQEILATELEPLPQPLP